MKRNIALAALVTGLMFSNTQTCRADASDGTFALTMKCLNSSNDHYDAKCVGKLRKKLEKYILKGDNPEENRWIANALVTYYDEEHIANDATTAVVRGKQQVYLTTVQRGEIAADQIGTKHDAIDDDTLRWMRDKAQYQAEAQYLSSLDPEKYKREIKVCNDEVKFYDRRLNPKSPSAWGMVLLAAAGAASDTMAARQQQAQQQAAQQQAQIAAQQQQAQIAAQQRAQAQAAQQSQIATQQRLQQQQLAMAQVNSQKIAATQQAQLIKQQQAIAQARQSTRTAQTNSASSFASSSLPSPNNSDISTSIYDARSCSTGVEALTRMFTVQNNSYFSANVRLQLIYHLGGVDSTFERNIYVPGRQSYEGTIENVPCGDDSHRLEDYGKTNILSLQFN